LGKAIPRAFEALSQEISMDQVKISDLVKKRAVAFDAFQALAAKETLTADEEKEYTVKKRAVEDIDGQIKRAKEHQTLMAAGAQASDPSGSGDPHFQIVEDDPYTNDAVAIRRGLGTSKGLRAIAALKMFHRAGASVHGARELSIAEFGERHWMTRAFEMRRDPITRALVTSVGASGGFIVPPDYMNEIIELLRPKAQVRSSSPRVIPMPRGTMTMPSQTAAGTAGYGSEISKIASSQQTVGQIVASFKKLTALVPVTNDLMRYADPAADAFVRDDLVKIVALREDLAFLLGDGTQATPMGYTAFANRYAITLGGTAGNWLSTANSTAAVGGNFITSNETYTLATAAQELGGLVNKLDTANVEDTRRTWFMHPRTYNYLFNVQNSLGVYVYREELATGKLLTYPVKRTTQIPINIFDTTGTNVDCSFIILAEMDESMILDSMSLELAVSREGTYVDGGGTTWSAFQSDQTLIRAIAEHDFQIRHDAAVAVAQFVRWAPAIS
jgi:HK97 family phage major capsid protein